jgi:nucleoside 2-deoxyribosyltransferase
MSRAKTKVYFAGPLFTQAEWQWNAAVAASLRRLGFEVSLPQDREKAMRQSGVKVDAAALFAGNLADIERADVIVAVLDGADPDSGTCWEAGYAYKAGRPVIGLRTDLRAGGDVDLKSPVNLMLSRSCAKIVLVPPSQRVDVAKVGTRVAEAIKSSLDPKTARRALR